MRDQTLTLAQFRETKIMRVTLVRDIKGLAGLRDQWQPLLNRCRPNHVFMTWEWFFAWWKHFMQGRELFVLVVQDKGEIIGILPLMLFILPKEQIKLRYLHFIGFRFEQAWNDWIDIIAVRKGEVIRAALEYLKTRQYLWDYLDLWQIPEDSDTLAIISDLAPRAGFSFEKQPVATCPYLPTTSNWETYYHASSLKRARGDIERQIRRLGARGKLEVQWIEAANLVVDLESFFDLYERRWTALNQRAMFSQEVYRNFYRTLAQVFPRELLDCSFLKLDGRVIAAHFGFRYNHKLYLCTPTFDPDYAEFGPGKILLRYMIENCFADPSIHEFDFLAGSEAYKFQWATGERRSCRILIANAYSAGLAGRVLRRVPLHIRRPMVGGLRMLGYMRRGFAKEE